MAKLGHRPGSGKRREYVDGLPSMTDQSFKQEVNVNAIMAKFKKTGQIGHVRQNRGQYLDVSNTPNLMEAFARVRKAEESFATLPAAVREKLRNDPANLSGFLNDPKNREMLEEYGVLEVRKGSGESTDSSEGTKVPPAKPAPKKAKSEVPAGESE